MQKLSITLPDEIVQAVKERYPDTPFSAALAKIVRRGLENENNTTTPTNPTAPAEVITKKNVQDIIQEQTKATDFTELIRSIIRTEIAQAQIQTTPVQVEVPIQDNPVIVNTPAPTETWLTNAQVAALLPETIPHTTRVAKVSKAVSSGKLISNGQKQKNCRISRASAVTWSQAIVSQTA